MTTSIAPPMRTATRPGRTRGNFTPTALSASAVSRGRTAFAAPPTARRTAAIANGPARTLTVLRRSARSWSAPRSAVGRAPRWSAPCVDGSVVVVVLDVVVGPRAARSRVIASTSLTRGTSSLRRANEPMTTYRQNARPWSLKNFCTPAWPRMARCMTLGLKSSAVSGRGMPALLNSAVSTLEGSYSNSTTNRSSLPSLSTAPLAKSPTPGGTAIVDTCSTAFVVSCGAAGSPSMLASCDATSPSSGRRNRRPSHPVGSVTSMP